jgi:predicted nucleotidyltransferase
VSELVLPADDLAVITQVLDLTPGVRRAVVFGSRAKGNAKPGSDVDLAVWGQVDVAHLTAELQDEGPLPYLFDVVPYETLRHEALKEHINRVGIEIYRRE